MLARIADANKGLLEKLLKQSLTTSENITSVSASAEQLTHSIQQIIEQVSHSANATKEAVNKASNAGQVMDSLYKETSRISDVLAVMGKITDQINMLALNASIEAARAGAAGKGFSVVASEVKTLATKSREGTQEVYQFITNISEQARLVASAIHEIRSSISDINTISSNVSEAIITQDAATRNIASNIHHTATLAEESKHVAETSSAATHKISTSAIEMLNSCQTLTQQSSKLNVEVVHFLGNLQQA